MENVWSWRTELRDSHNFYLVTGLCVDLLHLFNCGLFVYLRAATVEVLEGFALVSCLQSSVRPSSDLFFFVLYRQAIFPSSMFMRGSMSFYCRCPILWVSRLESNTKGGLI